MMTQKRPVGWRQMPGLSSSLRQSVEPISKASATHTAVVELAAADFQMTGEFLFGH
jgi:hypothetical protein